MGQIMRNLGIVLGAVILATSAFASEQSEVMAPVHQFVDGFNKGDVQSALAACADEVYVIDEFAPYQWSGAGACSTWANDYVDDARTNGITEGVVTLGKPKHVDIAGDRAYVVVPASYSWKQNGRPMKESASTLIIVLQKQSAGWRITAWTWAKQ
jgi:ketosteroid isomerase-like protein